MQFRLQLLLLLIVFGSALSLGTQNTTRLKSYSFTKLVGAEHEFNSTSICQCKILCIVDSQCLAVSVTTTEDDQLSCKAILNDGNTTTGVSISRNRNYHSFIKETTTIETSTSTISSTLLSTTPTSATPLSTTTTESITTSITTQSTTPTSTTEATTSSITTQSTTPTSTTEATTSSITTQSTTPTSTTEATTTSITTQSTTPTTTSTSTTSQTTTTTPHESYYTFVDANYKEQAQQQCLRQGRQLAIVTTQEEFDKFKQDAQAIFTDPNTLLYASLDSRQGNPRWKPYPDQAFSTTYIGQQEIRFELLGRDRLYAIFDASKALISFKRADTTPVTGLEVICMKSSGSANRNYSSISLASDDESSDAKEKCQDDNKQNLAVFKTNEDYQRLQSQLSSIANHNFIGLKFISKRQRLEWEDPSFPVSKTSIADQIVIDTSHSGDCFYATPLMEIKKFTCDIQAKAVCMPIAKIAEPGQQYRYEVHPISGTQPYWYMARSHGLQLAIIKTRDHIDAIISTITAANLPEYLAVALRWDIDIGQLMWEDDTPYQYTELATHLDTVEPPGLGLDCYAIHFVGGVYKGFTGGTCDFSHLLGMALIT